jgi:hypothetical protein
MTMENCTLWMNGDILQIKDRKGDVRYTLIFDEENEMRWVLVE